MLVGARRSAASRLGAEFRRQSHTLERGAAALAAGRPERRPLLRRRRPEEAQGAVPHVDQGLQGPAAQGQGRARRQGRAAPGQLLDLNLSRNSKFVYNGVKF